MTDILFGQSYFLRFDPKLYDAMMPYPPLGTLYAAATMREAGYAVALFDAMLADEVSAWDEALHLHQPRYAILFEDNFNYLSKMCLLNMREAAFQMTRLANQRGIPVIICGADATDHYATYIQHGADYVIRGEGEVTLVELFAHLEAKSALTLEQIPGLAYRDASGNIQTTPARPIMKNLDEMPFPAWDLVNVERYKSIWQERHGYYSVNMVTTRGCPYHCNWCAKPIWGQRYHMRSPQNVAAELAWLREHVGPDHVWFADDIFGLKPGWVEAFAEEIEARDIRTPFKALSRADLLTKRETVAALRRAGADIVWIGAESGAQHILDAMQKGTQVDQIREATRLLDEEGVRVAWFLQFGYPGEDRAAIAQTIQMVRDCLPDDIGISVSYPLPGTPFYERVKDDLQQTNWQDSADLAMLYRGPFPTAFYRQLHRVVHKDYRSRRTWQRIRGGQFRLREARSLAAMVYHRLTLPAAQLALEWQARQPHQPTQMQPLSTEGD
ncbi:MAG: B12-binding domain-containing radical SAM protein [Anaerolineales bacterium]